MKITSTIVVIGLLLAMGLGFAVATHEVDSRNEGCVTSVMEGMPCPTNLLNFALHHLAGLQSLFAATVPPLLLAVLLLLVALLWYVLSKPRLLLERRVYAWRPPDTCRRPAHKCISWLSLLETSPTY